MRSDEETAEDCREGVSGYCHGEGIPEWLEDFAENLEIAEVLAPAEICHDSDLERTRKVASRKHSVFTHFTKDQNCEVCKRTKIITRVLCRRRTGNSALRPEKFGDLKTADRKVFNEGSQSRHNLRYSVVVQDLATQWIPPVPNKNFSGDGKKFTEISRASEKPKVMSTDNSLEVWQSL